MNVWLGILIFIGLAFFSLLISESTFGKLLKSILTSVLIIFTAMVTIIGVVYLLIEGAKLMMAHNN